MDKAYLFSFDVVETQTTTRFRRWFPYFRKPIVETKDVLVRKSFYLSKLNGDFVLANQNDLGRLFREMVPKGGAVQMENVATAGEYVATTSNFGVDIGAENSFRPNITYHGVECATSVTAANKEVSK